MNTEIAVTYVAACTLAASIRFIYMWHETREAKAHALFCAQMQEVSRRA